MIENITHKNLLLSVIIRAEYQKEGISFFTPDNFSQQLGYMNRPQGYVIPPHVHNLVPREVSLTQEVLYIKSGKVRVDFMTMIKTICKVLYCKKATLFFWHTAAMVLKCWNNQK